MTHKRILNDFQKKALDEDTQVLLESGMVNDNLLLSERGVLALLNWLLQKHKKAIAQSLKDEWAELESMTQEDKQALLSELN